MKSSEEKNLSRREREIMDIIYEAGSATAAEVRKAMDSPPSYSAVRALLRILEEKGHLKHLQEGPRYNYMPRVSRNRARKNALRRLLRTFFDGSPHSAVAALLDMESSKLTREDLDRLALMIEQAKVEEEKQ